MHNPEAQDIINFIIYILNFQVTLNVNASSSPNGN